MNLRRAALAFVSLGLFACGAAVEKAPDDPVTDASSRDRGDRGPGISMESEVGALNEAAVTTAFQKSADGMLQCLKKASNRLPYISGVAGVYVRVGESGVKYAYMKRSSLGDRDTEQCMLDIIRKQSWPAPVGGKEGFAENEFTFDPPDRVRMPVSWSEGDAGKTVEDAKKVLARCKAKSASGRLTATLYVETDGSVLAAGVSGEQPGTEQAASCVVDGLKAIKLGSPGSFAAKLTLTD